MMLECQPPMVCSSLKVHPRVAKTTQPREVTKTTQPREVRPYSGFLDDAGVPTSHGLFLPEGSSSSSEDDAEPKLSPYELQRLGNIAWNHAYMESIGLGTSLLAATAPKKAKRAPVQKKTHIPVRTYELRGRPEASATATEPPAKKPRAPPVQQATAQEPRAVPKASIKVGGVGAVAVLPRHLRHAQTHIHSRTC
jgi:hypothetical protein